MTINLTHDLEEIIERQAQERRSTPESIVVDALCEKFLAPSIPAETCIRPLDDWKARLRQLSTHCGVSLSDHAVSSDGLYE